MCLICDHFNKGLLTVAEAGRNLDEISDSLGPEHTREVTAMIIQHEIDQLIDSLDVLPMDEDFTLEDAIFDMDNMDFDLDFTV